MDPIEGRVTGARPGDRIVLYARSGEWWVQPLANQPFTTVERTSDWKNRTHPGTAYAALLVTSDYHPSAKAVALPHKGGAVLAVQTVASAVKPTAVAGTILFGGYEWRVRNQDYSPGGTLNHYDPGNAWIDKGGLLHLRIAGSPERWTSGEVTLTRSLGYGTYRFVIRELSHLEPSTVFTMFAWSDKEPSEMDIEVSRWGELSGRNGQFVIQPFDVPANTVQFQVPAGKVTFMLRWSPERASFRAFRGAVTRWDTHPIREHAFTSGVPLAGEESIHMNLYVFGNESNPQSKGTEVVIEAFEYLP